MGQDSAIPKSNQVADSVGVDPVPTLEKEKMKLCLYPKPTQAKQPGSRSDQIKFTLTLPQQLKI